MTTSAIAERPAVPAEPVSRATRPWKWRAARVALLALAGVAVLPSVLPFTPESGNENRVCVPVVDGWHGDREAPPAADFEEQAAAMQKLPSPEAMRDPSVAAAWVAAEKVRMSSPAYQRVNAYVVWATGPGECVSGSRQRLIGSGLGLGGVVTMAVIGEVARRRL